MKLKTVDYLNDLGYDIDDLPESIRPTLRKDIAMLVRIHDELEEGDSENHAKIKKQLLAKDEKILEQLKDFIALYDDNDTIDEDEHELALSFVIGLPPSDTLNTPVLYEYCKNLMKYAPKKAFITTHELTNAGVKPSQIKESESFRIMLANQKDIALIRHKEKGKIVGFAVHYRDEYLANKKK